MTLTLSGSAGITNPQGSTTNPSIGIGTNTAGIYWPNAAIMGFTVNGAEAMRIDQQGNVLIGTTTNLTGSVLTVRNFGSNNRALAIGDTNTAASSTGLYFYTTSTANISVSTGGALTFNTAGGATELMRITSTGNLGIGSTIPLSVLDMSQRTDAVILPIGTADQRPASPINGMIRYNSTYSVVEAYQNNNWYTYAAVYSVEYLVVGGGGGGGYQVGGGGGAGGYVAGVAYVTPSTAYTITVGTAGSAAASGAAVGTNGGPSSFGTVATALGGGYGSSYSAGPANSGGSGGGGSGNSSTALYAPGAGTAGQGFIGGTGVVTTWAGGGGGGASSAGLPGSSANGGTGGAGGPGKQWLNGTYYAGGGGGCGNAGSSGGTGGAGGTGGGGTGGTNTPATAATNGTPNTGGGGGGTRDTGPPGNGGTGIVIIRYPGAQRGSGGTVSSSGGYTYHTFLSGSTFTA